MEEVIWNGGCVEIESPSDGSEMTLIVPVVTDGGHTLF